MNIILLSELASTQIGLLGYIQISGECWYVQTKNKHRQMEGSDAINPSDMSAVLQKKLHDDGLRIALNYNKSYYFVLTTNQDKALRI